MIPLPKKYLVLATATAVFAAAIRVQATNALELASRPAAPAIAAANQAATATAQVAALRSAYSILAGANQDYGNHRRLAMQAVAQACALLGAKVSASNGAGEWQIISDLQLHQAQATLQLVRAGIGKGQQPRVAALLDSAIAQIDLALAVN